MKRILKNKITLSILALIVIIIFIFILTEHKVSPNGTELTEKKLIKDLKVLGGKELKIKYITIYNNGDIKEQTVEGRDGIIDRKSRIIEISTSNKKEMEINKPFDVHQAMRTWIYLKERKLPFEVTGVFSVFDKKWIIDQGESVLISKTEFEELYNEAYRPELSEEQLITELSDLWISKTNHKKWWAD